ncbi:MAG: efflux RND transporter periplasmic adaptor subunit [Alphaproteobacteria bacterium]|nr:efflux RND transporter periplasmic adaptor subunit [Alphaproteobacteria bacterium]
MAKHFIVVGLILAVVFGGLGWYQLVYKPAQLKAQAAARVPPPVTISAQPAKAETWQPALASVGTLRAVNGVTIAPELDGVVKSINFKSGEDVKAGTLLIELDDAVELAQLKNLEASLRNAKLTLERDQRLFKKGDLARATLDAAQTQVDIAEAKVAQVKAVIDQKRIRAPFDGRLGIREVDLGEYLSAGAAVVSLQALDPIYADFSLPEQELKKLKVGQAVTIAVDAFPGQSFDGAVTSMDAQINKDTRNIRVRATLANADKVLVPGMFANVRVLLPPQDNVVTVPATAITYSLDGQSVYVVTQATDKKNKDGTPALVAHRHTVKVGDRRDGSVAIVEGLKVGQRVVTSGQIKLQNGAHVRIDNSVALTPPKVRPKE